MALYEWRDGQLGNAAMQGGAWVPGGWPPDRGWSTGEWLLTRRGWEAEVEGGRSR